MNKNLLQCFTVIGTALFFSHPVLAQQGQLSIQRVDQMPDLPQPYLMRDWESVAEGYDAFIFDQAKSGTYLPLVHLQNSGTNYPSLKPIQLDTYVGTQSANQAEAINIIPAIVGALLVGVNKSSQGGVNWVEKTKDFFNSKNQQNIYLNTYSAVSGNDWWYDVMPNVFFYQLSTLYSDGDYESQFIAIADQWLAAVLAMGGKTAPWTVPNMNYRAWRLSSMTGNTSGVHEPEAAGAIAWLLYSAYVKTGQQKYLDGAQLSLEFLSSLTSNPSYELQLPYGTLTAARLNAQLGTNYDVSKMLSWSFERGPLRGWGTIVGTWDGKDVSGLIGEANDGGNDYAFMMNGYQQAAAFAPIIKYDKRYAKALSKWILNLANASRYYYPQFLDAAKQDDFAWSNTNDPESVIGYEALKENWNGNALYGTGDAKRNGWALTNLALYGSSHVGYLGAIVNTTDVDGVLRIDLNKTDFFGENGYPTYSYYNPHVVDHDVTLQLGSSTYDIYDAISETTIGNNVTGDYKVSIKASQVVMLTLLPSNAAPEENDGKLSNDGKVIDYHFGYNFSPALRIKSLSTTSTLREFNEPVTFYVVVENATDAVSYRWYVDDVLFATTREEFQWTTPQEEGDKVIRLEVTSGVATLTKEITVRVLAHVPTAPSITAIEQDQPFYYDGAAAKLISRVDQSATDKLDYTWTVSEGDFIQQDSLITWTVNAEGLHTVSCKVTNADNLSTTFTSKILVKDDTARVIDVLAYYPLNIDVKDYGGHGYNAVLEGTQQAVDALGNADFAYSISTSDDIIYVPNAISLNFKDEITVSCWISISPTGREAFILSHGSWEKRWKVSLTPSNNIRWTLKTGQATIDLDSKYPLTANKFYHVAVTYSGYSMELYIDGELNNFIEQTGSILQADEPITFGQKSIDDTQYFLNGAIDEVRIFDEALQPWQIATLKALWHEEIVTGVCDYVSGSVQPFPNPVVNGVVYLRKTSDPIRQIRLISADGRKSKTEFTEEAELIRVDISESATGLMMLEVSTETAVRRYKLFMQ